MKIFVNGEGFDCEEAGTVAELIQRHQLPAATTLVAMALRALVALLTSVAVWVAGALVERFCRVDRTSDDDTPDRSPV